MKMIEWAGVIMAIVYSLLIAANVGYVVEAFILLFGSSCMFMALAVNKRLWGMLTLQVFYAAAAIIGMVSWS